MVQHESDQANSASTMETENNAGGPAEEELEIPSPADQWKEVDVSPKLVKGDIYYLVSSSWWASFKRWSRGEGPDPGPIDNSKLMDGNFLRSYISEQLDYILVPEAQWKKLVRWHPLVPGQKEIRRQVIEEEFSHYLKVEVSLHRLEVSFAESKDVFYLEASSQRKIADVRKEACEFFIIPFDPQTRLKYMEDALVDNDLLGRALYYIASVHKLVLEKKRYGPQNHNSAGSSSSMFSTSNRDYSSSSSNHYSSSSSYHYGGRSSAESSYTAPVKGITGLVNLGNTCFMNSALQCLCHTEPLTEYFLSNNYEKDINEQNLLGMKGEIAREFGNLLIELWSGKNISVSPRDLKWTVSRFAPQFSGYSQHDSQELLAFLLDGLHEDLNKILKKPYLEVPDQQGQPDRVIAETFWSIHKKRNDSKISDIFQGQFKSRVVCPDCHMVSLTFDPFLYLSLPLPNLNSKDVFVTMILRDVNNTKPIRMKLKGAKEASASVLREQVSTLLNIPKQNLAMAEVYDHRFHQFYPSNHPIKHICDDDIYVFELGAPDIGNESDLINLRVILRFSQPLSYSNYSKNIGVPFVITVPRNIDYEGLYKEVKKNLSRFELKRFEEDETETTETETTETDDSQTQIINERTDSKSMDVDENKENQGENQRESQDTQGYNSDRNDGFASDRESTPIPQKKRFFKLHGTDSYNSTIEEFEPTGSLELKNNSYIAAIFEKDVFKEYFDEDKFIQEYAQHPTMTQKEEATELSVKSCLRLFSREEKLEEDNTWYCPTCKDHKQASKKLDLWKLPECLIIHLKRFSYSSIYRDKIDSHVDFPINGLDLSEFVLNPEEDCIYDLYAVSNHYGGMGGGHYTAYAKNKEDGQWYTYDDSSVRPMSVDGIVTPAAYVLFYQRRSSLNAASDVPVVTSVPKKIESLTKVEEEDQDKNIEDDSSEDEDNTHKRSRSSNHNHINSGANEMNTDGAATIAPQSSQVDDEATQIETQDTLMDEKNQ